MPLCHRVEACDSKHNGFRLTKEGVYMDTILALNTDQFGEIKFKNGDIITFVQPIIGFNGFRRYVFVEDKAFFPIQWLQSVDNPHLVFPIINPGFLSIKYDLNLHSYGLEDIKSNDLNNVVIYTFLVIPPEGITEIRTNLRAPIIINPSERLAKQVIYEDSTYPVHYYILK